jgi:hypothetical protein
MQTWMIVAIIAAVAVIFYFVMRTKTLANTQVLQAVTTPPAPGVLPQTGTVPPNQPPPPPPDVQAPTRTQKLQGILAPSAQMTHIPIIGNPLSAIARAPAKVTFAITDKVNNTLSQIPVAGKVLAAPGKAVTSAVKSFYSWL